MTTPLVVREQKVSPDLPIGWDRATLLHRINPLCNEARFYYILVGPALLDRHAVVRVWGRIGGQQQGIVTPCQTGDEARTLAEKLVRRRLKRGYTLVQDKARVDL
ncbi:MAG: WGR domain-containing protein [Chloroflexota bacterium]